MRAALGKENIGKEQLASGGPNKREECLGKYHIKLVRGDKSVGQGGKKQMRVA